MMEWDSNGNSLRLPEPWGAYALDEPERDESWDMVEPKPPDKRVERVAGFCVFCGAGLTKEEAKSAPMRCYRCAGSYSATIATGTEIPSARFCWRCGDRYEDQQCLRCDRGLTSTLIWEKAQAWRVPFAEAKRMMLRGEAPEIAPDDDITF